MTFELVEKEDARGVIAGSDYGSSVRIMARSPTHVMFNALGCQLWDRDERGGWHSLTKVFGERATKAKYEAAREKIDGAFGVGATDMVLEAWRLHKTVLVDGGGAVLVEPGLKIRDRNARLYAEKSCTEELDLSGEVPGCLQCGKTLIPHTKLHHMGHVIQPDHPRSLTDCQKLTNRRVVAVRSFDGNHPDKLEYVSWFESWDGETLRDPHFCGDTCAAKFGRRAAAAGTVDLEPGVEPVKVRTEHESQNHYEEPVRHLTMPDGRRIRIS